MKLLFGGIQLQQLLGVVKVGEMAPAFHKPLSLSSHATFGGRRMEGETKGGRLSYFEQL